MGASRAVVLKLLQAEWRYSPPVQLVRQLGLFEAQIAMPSDTSTLWSEDMKFYGPSGIGFARGYPAYATHVLALLWSAFTNASFALDVLSCEGHFCGAHGYLHATHSGCFAGQPPTGLRVAMRASLHWHVEDGVAIDGYFMTDMPALFAQFGVDLYERALSDEPLPPQCDATPALQQLMHTHSSKNSELRQPASVRAITLDADIVKLASLPTAAPTSRLPALPAHVSLPTVAVLVVASACAGALAVVFLQRVRLRSQQHELLSALDKLDRPLLASQ